MAKHDWSIAERLAAEGNSYTGIAKAMPLPVSQVWTWAKTHGVSVQCAQRDPKGINARNQTMAEMYRRGLTLERIGAQFKLTRERVRQIMKRMGLERVGCEFRAATTETVSETKRKAFESRIQAKWGCGIELWRELRANGTIHAYEQQRQNSRNRGIKWTLTFAQWYAIWQASGKLHLRGRGEGKYCMSRIKDDGPYSMGNVHIQLGTENSADAVEKWRGKEKAIRGVFHLYPGREMAWFAKVGKKSIGFFKTAEEAGAAREAYMAANGVRPTRAGCGKGWTLVPGRSKPYQVQFCGRMLGRFATQDEAEAVYRAAVGAPRKPSEHASARQRHSDRPSNLAGEV